MASFLVGYLIWQEEILRGKAIGEIVKMSKECRQEFCPSPPRYVWREKILRGQGIC